MSDGCVKIIFVNFIRCFHFSDIVIFSIEEKGICTLIFICIFVPFYMNAADGRRLVNLCEQITKLSYACNDA